MRVVSRGMMEMIVLQHLARSVVARDTKSVIIERRLGQVPNWIAASHDPVVKLIVADLQSEYALEE
jgi:hypothetical protein